MTWGQIRLLVQQGVPAGITLDQIDQAINARYELILSAMEWEGIEKTAMLATTPIYNAGQVNFTQGSNAVTGIGTAWTTSMTGLSLVQYPGSSPYVVTITSPTTLSLDRPFENCSSITPSCYAIEKQIYQLPDDCRLLKQIQNPITGLALEELSREDFADGIGFTVGEFPGEAYYYIPQPDGVDAQTGATVKQVTFFPLPACGRSYPITYDQQLTAFDGTNTSQSPLAFVSPHAIIAGAKAILLAEKQPGAAAACEAQYQQHLAGMIHADNGQKGPQRMKLEKRFTRYRMWRVFR